MLDSWQARRLSSEPLEATRGRFLRVPSCHHRLTYTKSVIHELDGLGVPCWLRTSPYISFCGMSFFLFSEWKSKHMWRTYHWTWKLHKKNQRCTDNLEEKRCSENGSRWVCKRWQSHFAFGNGYLGHFGTVLPWKVDSSGNEAWELHSWDSTGALCAIFVTAAVQICVPFIRRMITPGAGGLQLACFCRNSSASRLVSAAVSSIQPGWQSTWVITQESCFLCAFPWFWLMTFTVVGHLHMQGSGAFVKCCAASAAKATYVVCGSTT